MKLKSLTFSFLTLKYKGILSRCYISKHNSYALKNFAELSATLKGLTIPSGKWIPAAVNQVPHTLNFPSRFPIQHKCGMFVQSPSECHWLHCVQGFRAVTHSYKPHKHTQTRHPEPHCVSSSLTRFHRRITTGVWNQPCILDNE